MSRAELKIVTDAAADEITMIRELGAPRHLVIRAMTTPALIRKWLGGTRAEVLSAEVDFRVGGLYRYTFRARNGHEFGFGGVFREIADDRIVQTEKFDDYPTETTVITTFAETEGRTLLTVTVRCASPQVRDLILASGMAAGAGESYERLDALLREAPAAT